MASDPAYIPFFQVTGLAAVFTNFVAARTGSMGRFFRGAGAVCFAAVSKASFSTAVSTASSEGAAAASSSAPAPSRSSAHRRVNACDGVPMVTDAGVTNAAADEAVSERRSAL